MNCSLPEQRLSLLFYFISPQIAELNSSNLKWVKKFPIGSVIEGTVQSAKESGGFMISFKKYNEVLGFITHHQRK